MRRFLGFLLGVAISAGLIYTLRRFLNIPSESALNQPSPAPTPPSLTPVATETTEGSSDAGQGRRYVVRRTGPRPQAIITEHTNGNTPPLADPKPEPVAEEPEPTAVLKTDETAISPRSETTEPPVPDDVVVEPVAETAEDTTSESPNNREAGQDDFLPIRDLGPRYNQKLQKAGITTYAQLASLSPEEIEGMTGISAARIRRNRWCEQAARMAQGLSPE